jgi:hypothetical protein
MRYLVAPTRRAPVLQGPAPHRILQRRRAAPEKGSGVMRIPEKRTTWAC